MTSYYYVTDAETSIKNRGEEAIGKFKAHPMHPDNQVVLSALRREGTESMGIYSFAVTPPEDCSLLVGHNIGFDLLYYYRDPKWREWSKTGRIWDTMLAEYLLTGQESKFASLDKCAEKYGGTLKDDKIKEYWENDIDTEDIPKEELEPYLIGDIKNTELVFLAQMEKAHELGMLDLIDSQMEARLATIEMEWNGMHFDKARAEHDRFLLQSEQFAHGIAMGEFLRTHLPDGYPEINAGSNKLLAAVLFGGVLKYDVAVPMLDKDGNKILYKSGAKKGYVRYKKQTMIKDQEGLIEEPELYTSKGKSGVWGVDDNVLHEIINAATTGHLPSSLGDIAEDVLSYRGLEKDIKTYYIGYGDLCWPTDSCIHPNFNHVRTNTGRLSSSNPNMQNSSHNKE